MPAGYYPQQRLARAYVAIQEFGPTFPPDEALFKGTLFPPLYMPYVKGMGPFCKTEVTC